MTEVIVKNKKVQARVKNINDMKTGDFAVITKEYTAWKWKVGNILFKPDSPYVNYIIFNISNGEYTDLNHKPEGIEVKILKQVEISYEE